MPRPLTYRDSDEAAQAGAATLNRMDSMVADERRYQEQLARQNRQDARADSREQRIDESVQLDNDVRRYNFEKTKSLDENAKRLKVDLDKQTTEANQALREISLDDDNAESKIADWGAKYFRVIDPEIGDQRLQKQYELNLKLLERRRIEREKANSVRQAQQLAKEEGLRVKSISGDSVTYGRDDAPVKDVVLPSLERERAMHAKMLDRAKRIRAKATDDNIIKDADADIQESEAALNDIESQIRTHRESVTGNSTKAASPQRIAVNPQTGEKVVFQNGQWQPLK